jgi:hypothetical protein
MNWHTRGFKTFGDEERTRFRIYWPGYWIMFQPRARFVNIKLDTRFMFGVRGEYLYIAFTVLGFGVGLSTPLKKTSEHHPDISERTP